MDHQITPEDNFLRALVASRTPRRVSPVPIPPTTIPGISKPVNLGDEGSFAGTSFSPDQHAVASYVRILTPKLVNEFRVGFNRFRLDYTADQYEPGAALGNQAGRAERERDARRAEPAHLLAVELYRHRADAFAADLPAREHVRVRR